MSLLNNRSPIFQSFITALDAAMTSCLHTLGDYFSSLLAFHLHTVDIDNFITTPSRKLLVFTKAGVFLFYYQLLLM